MDVTGSLEYVLTWKHWDTPSGSSIFALRASGRRTSDSDCGGEPCGYPTPAVQNSQGGVNPHGNTGNHFTLQTAAGLVSGYPTPQAGDEKWRYSQTDMAQKRLESGKQMCLEAVGHLLTGYNTPRATDGTHGGPNQSGGALPADVAGYVTPSARDFKDTPGMSPTGTNPDGTERTRNDQLPRQIHGLITPSDTTETARPGVLDAAFSRWLMGYPAAWDRASPNFENWREVQVRIASAD